ncbi:hypothetical protein J7K27_06680 [Candidatus Bathyarchaeota archaeon]|nr:hypothetical protein [Candidatus Bathyarchaeota archaeon]
MPHKSFDDVWEEIKAALSNKKSVETLVRKVKNDIISVENDHIKIKSQKTEKVRKVPRSQFEHVWNRLVNEGFYISKDHKPYVHSQIICVIFSLLEDYIEVKYNPLTLYLK